MDSANTPLSLVPPSYIHLVWERKTLQLLLLKMGLANYRAPRGDFFFSLLAIFQVPRPTQCVRGV